jgi:hypothetical protein
MKAAVAEYQAIADGPKQDPVVLLYRKVAKRQVDTHRDEDISRDGVVVDGVRWYSDPVFQVQLIGFVTAFLAGVLPPDEVVKVRATDGTLHDLSFDQLKKIAGALLTAVQGAYVASWNKKSEIDTLPLDKLPLDKPPRPGP